MSEQNIALLKETYEAFGRGDVPAVLGTFADDIEWHEAEGMPYGGLHHGPQAVAENVFGPVTQDIDDFAVTPEEYYAGGDEVVVIAHYTGTGSEGGKELDMRTAHAWTVRDGKLTRFRMFADATVFNAVLAVEAAA
jgi:uncharacterized protein